MIRIKKTAILMAITMMVTAGTTAWAAESNLRVSGENDQILTRVTTVAGSGEPGDSDGQATNASFRQPRGLLVTPDGSVVVADSKNQVLRKLSQGEVTTAAGLILEYDTYGNPIGGWVDGRFDRSFFDGPAGLAADDEGNIYIADAGNHVIRVLDVNGNVTTLAGNGVLGNKDGKGQSASFYYPLDIAVAGDGTVYVADTLNHLIRKITADGVVSTLNAASTRTVEVAPGEVLPVGDFADGDLAQAKFNEPAGLAIDEKGNLYVSDSGNQRIRYIDFANDTVSTVAGGAPVFIGYEEDALYVEGNFADGSAQAARFASPAGLALTDEGGLLIADSQNHSIRYLVDGMVTTIAGERSQFSGRLDSTDRHALLNRPTDVAVSEDGSILVADSYNNQIRRISWYRLPEGTPQNDEIKVVYEDQLISFEVQPEIQNGRTMVPVRAITEALGFQVEYAEADQVVRISRGDAAIELYVGQPTIKTMASGSDPMEKEIDAAPYINGGSTFVPIRFLSEELGLDVQWNDARRTVILRDK